MPEYIVKSVRLAFVFCCTIVSYSVRESSNYRVFIRLPDRANVLHTIRISK